MQSSSLASIIIGLLLGLITGFVIANGFYRADTEKADMSARTPQSEVLPNNPEVNTRSGKDASLSPEEIRSAIANVENEPQNLKKQRELGLALYRYSALEQKVELLPDVVRLLERAEKSASPKDAELFVTLGDALFILAREREPHRMKAAQTAYQKALQANPRDADLFVSIGQTYFYAQPSDYPAAVKAYSQALAINPNHERSLENIVKVQLDLKKTEAASATLEKLRRVNPQNPVLSDFQTQLAQQKIEGGR